MNFLPFKTATTRANEMEKKEQIKKKGWIKVVK